MSWQQYVDANLVGTGTVPSAGIYDKAGNPWAYSAGFAAQVAEVKVVADALATGDPSCLAGTGAVVAGVKYMFVRGDADSVYVKKGAEGVYFFMCNTCVVVAYHNDKVQAGACNATAGKLVDFLKENSI